MTNQDVLVKHVERRTYDAFFGQGWENWTRFIVKGREVIVIKGQKISPAQKKQLLETVEAENING